MSASHILPDSLDPLELFLAVVHRRQIDDAAKESRQVVHVYQWCPAGSSHRIYVRVLTHNR